MYSTEASFAFCILSVVVVFVSASSPNVVAEAPVIVKLESLELKTNAPFSIVEVSSSPNPSEAIFVFISAIPFPLVTVMP